MPLSRRNSDPIADVDVVAVGGDKTTESLDRDPRSDRQDLAGGGPRSAAEAAARRPNERGAVRADTHGERADRHERKARIGCEHAAAVSEVLPQSLEPPESQTLAFTVFMAT